MSSRIGIGAYYEETYGDFELGAAGVLLVAHPVGGLKLGLGGGLERKLAGGKKKALIKTLVGYDFHVGKLSIGPMAALDFIEDHTHVFYAGIALGIGF